MRYLFFLFVLEFVSCSNEGSDYDFNTEIVDQLFECKKEQFKSEGKDLELNMQKFEDYCVKNNILKSSSPAHYREAYLDVLKNYGEPLKSPLPDTIWKLVTPYDGIVLGDECVVLLDSISQFKSKEVMVNNGRLLNIESGTEEDMYRFNSRVLKPKHFKHPYFRYQFMFVLISTLVFEEGQETLLPMNSKEKHSEKSKLGSELKVFINSKDEIYINGVRSELDSVFLRLLSFTALIKKQEKVFLEEIR